MFCADYTTSRVHIVDLIFCKLKVGNRKSGFGNPEYWFIKKQISIYHYTSQVYKFLLFSFSFSFLFFLFFCHERIILFIFIINGNYVQVFPCISGIVLNATLHANFCLHAIRFSEWMSNISKISRMWSKWVVR